MSSGGMDTSSETKGEVEVEGDAGGAGLAPRDEEDATVTPAATDGVGTEARGEEVEGGGGEVEWGDDPAGRPEGGDGEGGDGGVALRAVESEEGATPSPPSLVVVCAAAVAAAGLAVAATIRVITGRGGGAKGAGDAGGAGGEPAPASSAAGAVEDSAGNAMVREFGVLKAENLILAAKCEDLEEELLEMTGVLDAANEEINVLKRQITELMMEED